MAVWIGREKKLPMETEIDTPSGRKVKRQGTGGRNALPVFIKTMQAVYENRATEIFPEATDPNRPFPFSVRSGLSPEMIEEEAGAPQTMEEDATPVERDDS